MNHRLESDFEVLKTHRLDLLCLTVQELLEMGTNHQVFQNRGFENPHGVITGENLPRTNRVADVREHPENIKWYYRIIVDRSRQVAVGSVSFHGSPDDRGMVEIGIGIAEAERGKGYAQEALAGMWHWVVKQPGVKFLRYTVTPENEPSMAIIRKFDFPLVGEQIDEEDGLELIFERAASEYLDLL